jgi:hypothetical protein
MIFDRNGKISILRVALLALGIGIVLIVGAIISFFADRAARQRPLDVALFPGAAVSVTNQLSPTDLETVYTADSVLPEDVLTHYQTRMNEFYGMGTEPELRNCKRIPPVGNYEAYDAGDRSIIPFEYICLFEASSINSGQYTRVNIQPGVGDFSGKVVIIYSQTWTP